MKRPDLGASADATWDAPCLSGGGVDFCGAERIKAQLEAYWRSRGLEVTVNMLFFVGLRPAIRAARYDVRSDMVNGVPKLGDGSARDACTVSNRLEH